VKGALDLVLAALPIALLILWMARKRAMPSNRALPLAALVLYALLLGYFAVSPRLVHAAVSKGVLTALTPVLIVWGAILLFKTMEHSGAMATVRSWLNGISTNRVAQLVILGWAFSFLIEGVSGFGTPAALAAPLLVGLGFAPLPVAILCLMMNTVPVSFGAVGMPTWFGLGGVDLAPGELQETAFKTAVIHASAALIIPVFYYRHYIQDGGRVPKEAMEDLGLKDDGYLGERKAGFLPYLALIAGAAVVLWANWFFVLPG
jgi:lactate permease